MFNLSTVDQHRFSRPGEVYVLDIHRTTAGLASISSDQCLSLLDPARLSPGPITSLKTDHGNLTSLRVFDPAASLVCTSGESGSVGVWDLRIQGEAAKVAQFQASETPILSLACSPSTKTIAVGTELQNHSASIYLWDVRSNPTPKAQYNDVHSDDVTDLSFHPSEPALLLSGSTDGLVSVYDTRIEDEDELTLQTFNHNASIHHAAFLTGSEVLALSHDERFALYDLSEERITGDATVDFGDLREALGCQYVANVTPKVDGSGAIVGAGAQDRQAFNLVFLSKGSGQQPWVLDKENSVGLTGAHGDDIVRAYCFFDEEQMVFTAGEDGCIRAWRSGN